MEPGELAQHPYGLRTLTGKTSASDISGLPLEKSAADYSGLRGSANAA